MEYLLKYWSVEKSKSHISSQEQYLFSEHEIQNMLTNEYKTPLNIDEDILNSYIACLKTCDLHRFASIKSSNDQMERLYDDSKKVIYEMEERLKSAA